MQEDKLYHYAVIRLVPKVEREEFINIGLILFSKREKFIRLKYHICKEKFQLMCSDIEYEEVKNSLETYRVIRATVRLQKWIFLKDSDGLQQCEALLFKHRQLILAKQTILTKPLTDCLMSWLFDFYAAMYYALNSSNNMMILISSKI